MAAPRLDRGPDQALHLIATTFYCDDCKMIVKGEVAVPCMSVTFSAPFIASNSRPALLLLYTYTWIFVGIGLVAPQAL